MLIVLHHAAELIIGLSVFTVKLIHYTSTIHVHVLIPAGYKPDRSSSQELPENEHMLW